MDPAQRRIAAARRNPDCVLLTYRDALTIVPGGESSESLQTARQALAQATAKIATLQTALNSVRARLAAAERKLPPQEPRQGNRMPMRPCARCGEYCTSKRRTGQVCRKCYLAEVRGQC